MKIAKIIRKIAMLLSLLMLITSTIGTTYGFFITSTESIENVFVPDMNVGGLTLIKEVEHPLGEGYNIPDNIQFKFKIELGSNYANSKLTTSVGELTTDKNGVLSVSVKPAAPLSIVNLEEGTVVKVTEQTSPLDGFAVKGEPTQTITLGVNGTAKITFVNTYTPNAVKPSNLAVNGIKILEGRKWKNGDTFSFVLEQKNGENWTELGTKTISYDADDIAFNQFNFTDIIKKLSFDKVGTYSFRMHEVIGNLENINYDKTYNHFTVLVTDVDMDGKLEINKILSTENAKVTEATDNQSVFVTFNNTFIPPDGNPNPITVKIDVNKKMKNIGELIYDPDGFEFILENTFTKEKTAKISDNKGKASFELTFTKADIGKIYTYKLSETDKGLANMTYDTSIHEMIIFISMNENNDLVATTIMDGETVDTLSTEFVNIYDAKKPDSPDTGDGHKQIIWIFMMIISGSMLIILVIFDKKQNKKA